ncbi:hypothetical protein SK571_11215 [Lentzea sp. BCCO 10_0798]|uniref:Uncharacterized protein n=1 Tax=Lentzea kristufekii TaxID=3095430 RepID=A0ABU4TQ24_9PSEU|nr:hypothetical protein [Lentzea sp. BCCO 10_0798]MDX8049951.1 hypothetical protein [Lentzea sp. BCCO 10_0798]
MVSPRSSGDIHSCSMPVFGLTSGRYNRSRRPDILRPYAWSRRSTSVATRCELRVI